MKKFTIVLAICLLSASLVNAQKSVTLKINHLMGSDTFELNKATKTPADDDFKFSRLQYYVGNIILVHDNGTHTPIDTTWFLVNAANEFNVTIGSHNITDLEEIRFGIGVEMDVNHLDPSLYQPSHPLAPKSPSMHWGWAAGYRFVAMEGKAGANFDQPVEIHALGDANYFQTIIATEGTLQDSNLQIVVNADYVQSMAGINVSSGLIEHAEEGVATDYLMNFATKVFSSSEGNQSTLSVLTPSTQKASIYPNPSHGKANLVIEESTLPSSIKVYDGIGRLVQNLTQIENSNEITQPNAGLYHIVLEYPNGIIQNIKWIVTR